MPEVEGVRPAYYGPGGVYEPVNVIDAWSLSFRVGTALAYMARAGKKPGVSALEDLQKAHTFLGMEIAKIQGEGGDIVQKQNSLEAEEAGEGSKNRLIFGDTPPPRPSTHPGTPEGADSASEWIEKTAQFLARKHGPVGIAEGIRECARQGVSRLTLLAYWRACQMPMTSLEWRRLLMTLPIEARREIMAANADWFLERLDEAEGQLAAIAEHEAEVLEVTSR